MRMRKRPALAAASLAAATALLLAGCSGGGQQSDNGDQAGEAATVEDKGGDSPYRASTVDQPWKKPDLVLKDTSGKPYDLRKETAGQATLLYFGYTHCPDICPTTMADIATAKAQLPAADREKLKVVFVTTDPERDTPKELRTWLDAFDKDFVGLTGDIEDVQRAAREVAIGIEKPKVNKDGTVDVTHGTQVLAFAPDNLAHAFFKSDALPTDYAHDLPLLLRNVPVDGKGGKDGSAEDAAKEGEKAASDAKAGGPELAVKGAYVPKPASPEVAAGYLEVRNTGGTADRLTRASSPQAGRVEVHVTKDGKMRRTTGLDVPANGTLTLSRGGNHLMVMDLKKPLKEGQKITVELTFARSGTIEVQVPVTSMTHRPSHKGH